MSQPTCRAPAPPRHCGPDAQSAFVIHARSHDAELARKQLADALGRGGNLRLSVLAKLALADDELERYLELAFPTGLDFDPTDQVVKEQSIERFQTWIRAKTDLGRRLHDRYDSIAALGDPAGAVVAASRIATIEGSFADTLFAAEIPASVRTGEFAEEKVDAFCDALTAVAEPVEARAVDDLTTCVTRARDHAHGMNVHEVRTIVEAAQPCLGALARLRPTEFPPLDEVFAASELVRLQLQVGVVENVAAATEYDQQNANGVAARVAGNFARAHKAYDRAVAVDAARPEAHYNLGLLEEFEASKAEADLGLPHYERAIEAFARAAARATGGLRVEAIERGQLARRGVQQIRAFIAANR
jgi:tetratricopeptide (TPR) repeat protein